MEAPPAAADPRRPARLSGVRIHLGSTVIDPIRIDHAERLYLAGRTPRTIQRTLTRTYGVNPSTARSYLARAKKRLGNRPANAINPDAGRARAESLLLEAAAIARSKEDPKALAIIAHRLAELDGAIGPRRLELSGPGGGPIQTHHDVSPRAILALLGDGSDPPPGDGPSGTPDGG